MPHVTILYAGLLGIISLVLSFLVGNIRGKAGVSIGDGGNKDLLLAMRRQANFVEYVPLALILIGFLEMNGVSGTVIHTMGAVLVISRIAHAQGLRADNMQGIGRLIGAAGTALLTLVASVWCIVAYFV
ncbi:MAG TPA: MAPEG family protein [Xanthomonadales bacterium]|nr:MAPEG family protein [Xanthomonadales bacterium]